MATQPQAVRAGDFVQSIGVNTHLSATATSYGNLQSVQSQLDYLGVHNIRDIVPSTSALAFYEAVGAAGNNFDLIVMSDPAKAMFSLDAMAPYLRSVEGANEVNVTPVIYQGLTGTAAVIAMQKALYASVHGDLTLNGDGQSTPVLNFSIAPGGNSSAFGNMSAYADYTNVHDYGQNGVPPNWFLQAEIKGTVDTPNRPTIVTEAGNYTLPDHGSGVNESVQAKWMLDTVLDDFKNGVTMTYLYQLEDGLADPAGSNPEDHYGLFRVDGTAKLAATALHNLTSLLADTGTQAQNFTPSTLQYSLTGLPSSGNQLLIQKSSGVFDLVLWAEPQIWNTASLSETAVKPTSVTVSLGQIYQTILVYDPLAGTAPIATYTNTGTIQVGLTDHPLIISISTAPSTSGAAISASLSQTAPAVAPTPPVSSGPVTLTTAHNVVAGGALPLTVTDNVGGNTITGGSGAFKVVASAGNDVIRTGTSTTNSVLLGGTGADTVYSYGSATVTGNAGQLTLTANGDLTVSGGTGSLSFTAKSGNVSITTLAQTRNTLALGNGANRIVSGGADTIHAGAGKDTIVATGPALVFGNTGTLSFSGGAGAATVFGGLGKASIAGGSGGLTATLVSGGTVVSDMTGALTVTDNQGGNTIVGGSGGLTFTGTALVGDVISTTSTSSLNNIVFSGQGTSTVTANGTTNIDANRSNLVVSGNGNLSINGGTGNITLTGGTGDEYVFTQNATKNLLKLGSGKAAVLSHGLDTITAGSGTSKVYASGAAVTLYGGSGSVGFSANAAANTYIGGAGSATIGVGSGGGGVSIVGGLGNITLSGGSGSEYVFTQTGTKNLLSLGSGKASVLAHGADTINAGSGAANVYAGGVTLINGGSGTLAVSGQSQAITVNGGTGAVRATAGSGGGYLKGGSGGGNILNASAGNTTLVGGGNGDVLTSTSNTGTVTLVAGAGAETLVGSSETTDLFVLTKSSLAHSVVIRGFTAGTDHLRFAGFGTTQPIASQQVVGSNLLLTLADNAQVTLTGITSLGANAII